MSFNARTALPRAVLLLALTARCGDDRAGLMVTVVAGSDVQRPTTLAVSWLSARGSIFQRDKLAVSAGETLASIFVELDRADTSDRRVLVRGMGPGAATSVGALRIAGAAAGRTEVLTLHATLPDADGDGIPDVIDDCRACADAGAGADAQMTPAPDADAQPDADLPDAGVPSADAPVADRAAPPPVDASGPPPTIAGLVGLWRMDDGTGITVRDSSPTGNPGTVMRPTGGDWGVGQHGGALELSGTNWVSVSSNRAYDATGGLTLSAWVFWATASPAVQVIIARQRGVALQNAFWLGLENNRLQFRIEDEGASTPLPAGRWVHVAGTYDGSKLVLFMDGGPVVAGTVTAPATTANRGVSIGADLNGPNPGSATSMFVGRLDEVAIFNGALTPAEVAILAK